MKRVRLIAPTGGKVSGSRGGRRKNESQRAESDAASSESAPLGRVTLEQWFHVRKRLLESRRCSVH